MESEDQLEKKLISQLKRQDFEEIDVKNISDIEKNLKIQLEKLNNISLSEKEFKTILNHLNKGGVFEKSKSLRDKYFLKRENNEEDIYINFFDFSSLEKNIFQVTNQIKMSGKYENRYDVTILINGLPLLQIELKKRGVEMKEAFNQINRYHKHSFVGTIFEFVQVFVISNGVDVKYFSNNHKQSYEQTFFWTDKENKKISELEDFAEIFLDKKFLAKYISEYIVLAESRKIPMVLRPYQYYAVKSIIEKVKNSNENGYIWHTTGSGKTLTSFKTAQILKDFSEIEKVLFIVDRKDLDIQTVAEFKSLDGNSVDGSNNTSSLVKNLENTKNNIIVSTIQKLDRALARDDYKKRFEYLRDKKVVIIFDEAHRGQFGDTHQRIKEFFKNSQMFGFTGTPIFAENANKGKTTKDIFGEALHKYIITDAIADNNVLGFHTEYVGKYTAKDLEGVDIKISDIDKKEIYESDERVEKISKYILTD
jgi:type I restriction enzyme R subunit